MATAPRRRNDGTSAARVDAKAATPAGSAKTLEPITPLTRLIVEVASEAPGGCDGESFGTTTGRRAGSASAAAVIALSAGRCCRGDNLVAGTSPEHGEASSSAATSAVGNHAASDISPCRSERPPGALYSLQYL